MFWQPAPPPYDPRVWEAAPFASQQRMSCTAWAVQGYGAPLAVYAAYLVKVLAYAGGWLFFCSLTPSLGPARDVASWWLEAEAFRKAIVWSLLFELLGLGCGSGPLTGRYLPPIGGALYFLRVGTLKLPLFPGAPIIGRHERSLLDVGLYALTCAGLLAALCAPRVTLLHLAPIAVLVAALGVLDKTLFLCARGEHYWTTLVVLCLSSDFVPGAKAVQAALWFWAGVSKLNHHFPAVVAVMIANSPVLRSSSLRKRMYASYPDDLRPSPLAHWMAHAGTALELSVPLLLLLGDGGTVTLVGLALMLALHGFITSNVPMGVPLEWNVMMVYGAFFLFWEHADTSIFSMSLPVAGVVLALCVGLPLVGNLYPARVPFLLAMRYYAGNWAYSVWLFKKGAEHKLQRLTKSSGWIYEQLARLYDRDTCVALMGKAVAFRLMHLHGRALAQLVPRAAPNPADYHWLDGEVVAGMVLGWNFGDGHLHDEQLLRAVQRRCAFEAGELRCVMVEAQPLGQSALHYRLLDAQSGQLAEGYCAVDELRRQQPWG